MTSTDMVAMQDVASGYLATQRELNAALEEQARIAAEAQAAQRAAAEAAQEVARAQDEAQRANEQLEATFSRTFTSAISQATSFEDALYRLVDATARLIQELLLEKAIREAMAEVGSSSGGGGFLGDLATFLGFASSAAGATGSSGRAAHGAILNHGDLVAFARGGVVDTPSLFPMSHGRTGLMGEAGAEAILPLTRGPTGDLGVEMYGPTGGDGGGDTYVTHVHISTGVAQTVRAEVMNMLPQIESVTRAGMIDAKRRNKMRDFR